MGGANSSSWYEKQAFRHPSAHCHSGKIQVCNKRSLCSQCCHWLTMAHSLLQVSTDVYGPNSPAKASSGLVHVQEILGQLVSLIPGREAECLSNGGNKSSYLCFFASFYILRVTVSVVQPQNFGEHLQLYLKWKIFWNLSNLLNLLATGYGYPLSPIGPIDQ